MKRSQCNQINSQTRSATKVTGHRSGFTLVELLVVMAIIGILVSMLAVAIGPVLTRVQEGAVTTELQQMDAAVVKFHAINGFYPPSFNAPGGVNSPADMLPYLTLLSANHRELSDMPGAPTGTSRLQVWWTNVGSQLDDRSSLVFWLSGVCANKQFPLTGGNLNASGGTLVLLPVAFNSSARAIMVNDLADLTDNVEVELASGITVERTADFDFKNAQFATSGIDLTTSPPVSMNLASGIRVYNTAYKNKKSDRGKSYFYRPSASYPSPPSSNTAPYPVAYYDGLVYANPNTFQIYTFGQDGLAEDVPFSAAASSNRDNLANFANGRIETFDFNAVLNP